VSLVSSGLLASGARFDYAAVKALAAPEERAAPTCTSPRPTQPPTAACSSPEGIDERRPGKAFETLDEKRLPKGVTPRPRELASGEFLERAANVSASGKLDVTVHAGNEFHPMSTEPPPSEGSAEQRY